MRGTKNIIELGERWYERDRPGIKGQTTKVTVKRERKSIRQTKFYTVQEVADMLRRDYKTILRWIAENSIEAQPMPQGYLISDEAIERFLDEQKDKRTG